MSKKYEKVKLYYTVGSWTKKMVGNAVKKGWITADEYKSITGEDYEDTTNA